MQPVTLQNFLNWKAPPRHDIIGDGVLSKGAVMFLYGEYGTYKSWLGMRLAVAVSRGTRWMGYPTQRSRVLMLNTEMPKREYQDRWKTLSKNLSLNSNGNILIDNPTDLRLDSAVMSTNLANICRHESIDLIILDNLYSAVQGDLTKNTDAALIIKNCKFIAEQSGCGICIVHHSKQALFDQTRGTWARQGAFEMFGSSFLTNWADTVLEVSHVEVPGLRDCIRLRPQKHRLAPNVLPTVNWTWVRRTTTFEYAI